MADQYLGFDLSTQQLKGIIVKSDLKLLHEAKVDFDADLAHYGIHKGVLTNPAEGEVYAPVAMWLEAVDLVLQRLKEAGADFSKIKGISGAGMQHGTVFWGEGADGLLGGLDGGKTLVEQLSGPTGKTAFSHQFSPNWQDASTQKQCEAFDKAIGGRDALAEATGSSAHHRFSGPQILRFHQKYPEAYRATSRISLVSSFLASVFLGKVAPIDISDVTGANLWDIANERWHPELLALAAGAEGAADLHSKLGDVALDGGAIFGSVSSYFVDRYNFNSKAQIIAFTGDNPSTILALPLHNSDAIVSLGTSTTFLMSTDTYKPDPSYHFMNHPSTKGLYMFMLCYKNGGLAREHIRDDINRLSPDTAKPTNWDAFNSTALNTPVLGQSDPEKDAARLALYFPRPEIVPNVQAGTWRFLLKHNNSLSQVEDSSPSREWPIPTADARAILESQFLSLRLRSQNLLHATNDLPAQPRRVYLVGGGAVNPAIAELAAQVLGGTDGVYKLDIGSNACALGAAYKAAWGVGRSDGEDFDDFLEKRWNEEEFVKKICDGYRKGVWERYGGVLKALAEVESWAVAEKGHENAMCE